MMKRTAGAVLLMLTILLYCGVSAGGLSKVGSQGEEVRSIQSVLKQKGYYTGKVDGIYGTATKNAVAKFQKDSNLAADGMVGSKTLKALGIGGDTKSFGGYSGADYELLARIISAESRGESYIGQVAVGAVVLNRANHPSFPNTVAGVVYQKDAFSCLYDGQFYQPVADSAYRAARDAINGLDPSGGAVYYYNPAKTNNQWIRGREVITTIGAHLFCE